jgi:hypothetical protein
LSDVERYIRSLERKERFVELPSSQDLGQMLTGLANRHRNVEGMFMMTPPTDSAAGHRLLTPEERVTPEEYAKMGGYERVLWTFPAGQPVSMADVDKDAMAMIPGPISAGEKGLGHSDTRVDDQSNLPRSFQSMSETFGLVRPRIDITDDDNPKGRISTDRRPVHDRLELRIIGVDTHNQ